MTTDRLVEPNADEDQETWKAAAIFGHAAHFFAAAADMMSMGTPYHSPEVQHMISSGRMKLDELPVRRH